MSAAVTSLAGHRTILDMERALRRRIFAPLPRLTVSEWADQRRRLSSESAAVPGRWTSFAYQREIMDACHSGIYRRVIAMLPSQTGKTEVFLNLIGYHLDLEPCPMLVVEPNLDMARALSKDRIDTMMRDTPALQGKLTVSARRDSDNTMLFKAGPGWRLTLVGASSPSGLAMRPVRLCLFDEVDRYSSSAGTEGDPVSLGEKRSVTFPNRLSYLSSSPGIKGVSRIEFEYEQSDQRKWMLSCPHCGFAQSLEWGGPDEPYGIKWDTAGGHQPETAAYLCAGCKALIREEHKGAMNATGRWVATHPGRETAGFQMTALASPVMSWRQAVKEFLAARVALKAGNLEMMKSFVNTVLARTWEEPGEKLDVTALRRETYPAEVPAGVGVLTMGVDVQQDRLEATVWGWGVGEESWIIQHHRIPGNPANKADPCWQDLEAVRLRAYQHEHGGTLRIRATAIDAGHSAGGAVAEYVRPRQRSGVYALRGASTYGKPIIGGRPGKSDKYKIPIWSVGTEAAKDTLFARLKRVTEPGPGFIHIPTAARADDLYLSQFANERAVRVTQQGRSHRVYRPVHEHAATEAIDCAVYNIVALWILGAPVRQSLERAVSRAQQAPTPAEPAPSQAQPAPILSQLRRTRPQPRRGGFVSNW